MHQDLELCGKVKVSRTGLRVVDVVQVAGLGQEGSTRLIKWMENLVSWGATVTELEE